VLLAHLVRPWEGTFFSPTTFLFAWMNAAPLRDGRATRIALPAFWTLHPPVEEFSERYSLIKRINI